MFLEVPQLFCKEHKEQITHINISEEKEFKLSLCNQCPKTNNSLSLLQAFQKGETHLQQFQQKFSVKQNQSSSIHKASKIIKDNFLLQSKLLENMLNQLDSIILEEELQMDQFLLQKKYGNYNLNELEKYAKFLVNAENISKNQKPLNQQKLDDIFNNFFTSFVSVNNEIFKVIQRLEKKITVLANIIKTDILEIEMTKNLPNEKIDYFDFFSFSKVLVIACEETLTTFNTRDIEFEKTFTINTDHKRITSLYLDQGDKQNQTIYTSGLDQFMKIWIKQYSKGYVLQRQFLLNSTDIFKIIHIPRQQQIITCSKEKLISWNSQSGKQLQNIGEKKFPSEILCIEINHSSTCIICQTANVFYIWNNHWLWNLGQSLEISNVQAFNFINNSQFVTFQQNNKIILWSLQNDHFIQQNSVSFNHSVENSIILYNQDQSIFACQNDEECSFFFFQLSDQMKLNLLQTVQGKNMKICVPQNGEYFIIYNFGQFSIRKASKMLEGA